VKFVERNWSLNTTLSGRSRDNLPNPRLRTTILHPIQHAAIGDLFDCSISTKDTATITTIETNPRKRRKKKQRQSGPNPGRAVSLGVFAFEVC